MKKTMLERISSWIKKSDSMNIFIFQILLKTLIKKEEKIPLWKEILVIFDIIFVFILINKI